MAVGGQRAVRSPVTAAHLRVRLSCWPDHGMYAAEPPGCLGKVPMLPVNRWLQHQLGQVADPPSAIAQPAVLAGG